MGECGRASKNGRLPWMPPLPLPVPGATAAVGRALSTMFLLPKVNENPRKREQGYNACGNEMVGVRCKHLGSLLLLLSLSFYPKQAETNIVLLCSLHWTLHEARQARQELWNSVYTLISLILRMQVRCSVAISVCLLKHGRS